MQDNETFGHGGAQRPEVSAGNVAYLLQELDRWVTQGILTREIYNSLSQRYHAEQQEILRFERVNKLLEEARSAYDLHLFNSVISKAKEAIELCPNNIECTNLLARAYESLGEYAEALATYESLDAMNPGDPYIQNATSRVQEALENQRQAQDQTVTLSHIAELARSGAIEEAASRCEAFVTEHPDSVDAHALLASLYHHLNRIDDAISQIKQALLLAPNNPNLTRQLSSYEQVRDRSRMEERIRQQRERVQEVEHLRHEKSRELVDQAKEALVQGRIADALTLAAESLRHDPQNAEAWALTAQAHAAQGEWKQAEIAWSEAVRRNPDNTEYRQELTKATEARAYQERSLWSKLWDKGSQAMEAFMEERNVQWVHLLGAAILLAGLIGVSAWVVTVQKLWGIVGRVMVSVVPLLVTAVFYYIGCRLKPVLKTTATSFHVIASALLPIDLIMMKHLFPGTFQWDWDHHLFMASLISTIVYAIVLYAARTRVLTTLTGVGFLAVSYFFMSSYTNLTPAGQGIWFAVVGFGYMLTAHWIRRRGWTPLDTPLNILAHAAMALALGCTMVNNSTTHVNALQAPYTLLAVSLAYVLAAYILDEARYLPVFAVILFGFVVLGLKSHGIGISQWYLYGFTFGIVGCALLLMAPVSSAQDKNDFAGWYQWFGLAVTAIAVLPTLVHGLAQAATYQMLPSGPELLPSILTCLVISLSYTAFSVWMGKPRLAYCAAVVFIYCTLLTIKLASRPSYEYAVWMMMLAVTMAASGWYLKRRYAEYGETLFNTGITLSAISAAISVGMWASNGNGTREAAVLVMLMSTVLYAFAARLTRRVEYLSSAILTCILGWGAGFSWLDDLVLKSALHDEINYGLYYLPVVALLMWMRRTFASRDNTSFATSCDAFALLLSVGLLALQGYYYIETILLRHTLWITLALYTALFTWQAWDRREQDLFSTRISAASVYAYMSLISFWAAAFYLLGYTRLHPSLIALVTILPGSVGASIIASRLNNAAKPYWSRALLASAAGVFALGSIKIFLNTSLDITMLIAGSAITYIILLYIIENSEFTTISDYGFGIGCLINCAAAYATLPTSPAYAPYACIAAVILTGAAFLWLAGLFRTRIPVYIATISAAEAASLALFRILVNSHDPSAFMIGFTVISLLLLAASWAIFRKREQVFAEASFAVGLVILSADTLVSLLSWSVSHKPAYTLTAFIVTATAAVSYATATTVLRRRRYLWPAVLTLSAAYGLAGAQWVMNHIPATHANYGAWYYLLVTAFAVGGHILHRKQRPSFAHILHFTATGLAVISLCLQPLYSTLSEFIALFAYGLLFAWVCTASRGWSEEKTTNAISLGSAYLSAALLNIGWLLMFEWIGTRTYNLTLYRNIAALTGVALSLISFRISLWMADRDWEWSARPLFWATVVAGSAWTLWPVVCGQPTFPISLITCTLAAVLYTWIASTHANRSFACVGIGIFTIGYLSVFLNNGGINTAPAHLIGFALAPLALALCTGYLSASFRSRSLAYMTTLTAQWSCFLLLRAGIQAAHLQAPGWYALGIAVIGLTSLCVYRILAKGNSEDLAPAPAHGSDVATTIAAVIACRTGAQYHWTPTLALAICAATYALSAWLRSRPLFLYPACSITIIAWGLAIYHALVMGYNIDFILSYLLLVGILGGLSYIIRGRGQESFATPVWRSAMGLSVACFMLQILGCGFTAEKSVSHYDGWETLLLGWAFLSSLYAAAAYLDRDVAKRAQLLIYLSCASLVVGLDITPLPPYAAVLRESTFPFLHAALGALWAAAAICLRSRSVAVWTLPLLVSAGIVEAIAVIYIIFPPLENIGWSIAAIITAAATFTWIAQQTQKPALIHLAGLAALGSLGLLEASYPAKWVLLLPLLIPALGAGILAQSTRVKEYAAWFPVLLWAAFAEYAGCYPSSLLSPSTAFCIVFIITMGLSAVFFQRLARIHDLPIFEFFAALSGLVAYWCIPTLISKVTPFNPAEHIAITILPYALLLAWLAWRLKPSDGEPLYKTYGATALALSITGAATGVTSAESLTMRTATMALYTFAYLWAAIRFNSRNLVHAINASAVVTWYLLYLTLKLPVSTTAIPCLGAWFALFGLMLVVFGTAMQRSRDDSQTAVIEYTTGAALCSISAFTALCGTLYTQEFGNWTIAALLMSTIANSTIAMVRRQLILVHAGFAGVVLSLYLIFYGKLYLTALDIYALPIGVYLIALPAISRFVGRQVRPSAYYSTGLAIMLGSGLVTLAQTGWASWNSYMLLGESVIAFLYGISRRMKVFLFFGAGFSAVWTAALVRDSVVRDMHGSTLVAGILGIIIGSALIMFASRSEQRRAEILATIRQAARSFREWE